MHHRSWNMRPDAPITSPAPSLPPPTFIKMVAANLVPGWNLVSCCSPALRNAFTLLFMCLQPLFSCGCWWWGWGWRWGEGAADKQIRSGSANGAGKLFPEITMRRFPANTRRRGAKGRAQVLSFGFIRHRGGNNPAATGRQRSTKIKVSFLTFIPDAVFLFGVFFFF